MFSLWTGDDARRGELHCNSLPLEYWSILVTIDCEVLSNGPDKKESTNCNEQVGIQKSANFIIVSTMLLIRLNSKFYEVFAKQVVYWSLVFEPTSL